MKISRVEPGFYVVVTIGGEEFEVVSMQGQAVRYTGVGPHWQVRVPLLRMAGGSRILHEGYTKREVLAWLDENYG